VSRIRGGIPRRQQVRAGAPDRSLTANAGLAVITGLCDQLGVIAALAAAVGLVKQRDRGFAAGELLTGIAATQLAGEDFLTGLDRQRRCGRPADHAGTGAGAHDRGGAGPPTYARAVAGGGVRPGGGDRPGAVAAAGIAGGRAGRRAGHDRSGHHRCGGLRPQEARRGV
jgi:hypothetical protein